MTKVLSTHVGLGGFDILHVEGERITVRDNFAVAASLGKGLEVTLLIRTVPGQPYQRSLVWFGPHHTAKAMVAEDHEVEVSDTPFSPTDMEPTAAPMPDDTFGGLETTLGA